MTSVQYVQFILDNYWETSRPARTHDVPKPYITTEKKVRQKRLRKQDVVQVLDGGPQNNNPKSLSWTEEEVINRVSILIRTTESRERFEGHRDENNDSDSWGGLYGEVKHILHERRRGDKEFDLVQAADWNDNSGNYGRGYWRGTWEVRLETRASTIELSQP